MTETIIPGFRWNPGPTWKRGYYPIGPTRPLDIIEGTVKHDAAGPFSALIAEVMHPTRQASWALSIPTTPRWEGDKGDQHYYVEDITWHCGKPGDSDIETAHIGNITLLGIEHAREGTSPAQITPFQQDVTAYVSRFIREHCAAARRYPPALAVNEWEHNWVSNVTSCPSNRIPWDAVLALINEEDDMTADEIRQIVRSELEEYKGAVRQLCREAIDIERGRPEDEYGLATRRDIARVNTAGVDLDALADKIAERIDKQALVKAVNDDVAERMKS